MTDAATSPVTLRFQCIEWARQDRDVSGVPHFHVVNRAQEYFDFLTGGASGQTRALPDEPASIRVTVYSPQAMAALKALPPDTIRDTLSEVLDTVLCYLASVQPNAPAPAKASPPDGAPAVSAA